MGCSNSSPAAAQSAPKPAAMGKAPVVEGCTPVVQAKQIPKGKGKGKCTAIAKGVCQSNGVNRYSGFTECTHRILFPFEDKFTMPKGEFPGFQLFTILKEGTIENRKALKPKKGKGLFGFGIPQTITPELAKEIHEKWQDRKEFMMEKLAKVTTAAGREEEREKYAEHPGNTPESLPFVFQRKDGTYALVQMWTVNIDDKFNTRFKLHDNNPMDNKFSPQAVDEIQTAMAKLFGKEAEKEKPNVKYAIAEQENEYPVYVGKGKDLIQMLRESQEIRDEMMIRQVDSDHILGDVVNFDWKTKVKTGGTKEFYMDLDTKYCLYIKTGGDKMPCVKTWDLFELDSVLGPPSQ